METKENKIHREPIQKHSSPCLKSYSTDNTFISNSSCFQSNASVNYEVSPNQKCINNVNEKPIVVPQFLSISSVQYKMDTLPTFVVNECLSVYPYYNNENISYNQQLFQDNYLTTYETFNESENFKISSMYKSLKENIPESPTMNIQNLKTEHKIISVPHSKIDETIEDKKYFEIEIGPNQYQVKDWFITPTNKLKINFDPATSDVISVYLKCDPTMGLKDPEIFLGAVSPKFNLSENRCICIPNLKISKEMIQGPTKGFKFRLKYSLLSKGKEVAKVFSEPFLLFSSGVYPDHLKLQKNKKENQYKFINDNGLVPKRSKREDHDVD